jgi:hypothetical protein
MNRPLFMILFGRAKEEPFGVNTEKQSIILFVFQLISSWLMQSMPASWQNSSNSRAVMLNARQLSVSKSPAFFGYSGNLVAGLGQKEKELLE